MATKTDTTVDPKFALVTVKLPWAVWKVVERMAAAQGVSRTEMLRRCISVMWFVQSALDSGGQLMVEDRDRNVERIEFHW